MPFKNPTNLNKPVADATDPIRLTLDEIDKDIAKLQAKRAELIEKLRQVNEYNDEQLEEHKKARKQQAHERHGE
jgi:hypothetical protein